MSAKIGPLNQHEYLHPHYGAHDCCLCKAEERIRQLESELKRAERTIQEFEDFLNGVIT